MSEYSAKSLMARTGKGGKNTKKLIGFLLEMEKNKYDDKSVKEVLNPILFYFKNCSPYARKIQQAQSFGIT